MKKKISKRKTEQRQARLKQSKKYKLILALSAIPSFILTVVFTVLYAFRTSFVWLSALTALSWFALGGLFIYSTKARWGYVNKKGVESNESTSVVTIYNIILIFVLGALFSAFTVMKIF